MKNYKTYSCSYITLFGVIITLLVIGLYSCRVTKKDFKTEYLFKDSLYHFSFCMPGHTNNDAIPDSLITIFYVGYDQSYEVNNNIFELSMMSYNKNSILRNVTGELDNAGKNQPVKDSQGLYLIRLKKNFINTEKNGMFDSIGYYYLFVSLKYSQFKDTVHKTIRDANNNKTKDTIIDTRKYYVSGYGHVYLGFEDTATGNLLFIKELKINKHKLHEGDAFSHVFKRKKYYYDLNKEKGSILYLFENASHKDNDTAMHFHPRYADSTDALNFNYIIVGNYNQIGGRKYLDISIDTVFHYQALKFFPYYHGYPKYEH